MEYTTYGTGAGTQDAPMSPPDGLPRVSRGEGGPAGDGAANGRRQVSVYRTRNTWKKKVLVALLAVVLLAVLGAAGLYGYAEYRYHQIHRQHIAGLTPASADEPMNILMIGNNSRCVLNGKQSAAFGSCGDNAGEVAGARSDVIMILHLDPTANFESILSIPRDLVVPVPGYPGEMKIDSTLNYGPATLIKTIEDDLGITINHFVMLNFDSFQGVVEALGGLDMYFPEPITDASSGLNMSQQQITGCLHLDGGQALQVVRARHLFYYQNGYWQADGGGDLSRIRRNHEFIRDLVSQVKAQGIGNPFTDNAILGHVAPQLTVDSGLSFSTMLGLVANYHSVNPSVIPQITLPVVIGQADQYYVDGAGIGSVVFPSQPFDQNAIDAWLGLPGPPSVATPPATVSVEVVNASGRSGYGTQVASALTTAGFSVTDGGTQPPIGDPAETLIAYDGSSTLPPSQRAANLAAAQRVAENFSGAVMLQDSSNLPAGVTVVVYVSSYAVVNVLSTDGPVAAGYTVGSPPHAGAAPSSTVLRQSGSSVTSAVTGAPTTTVPSTPPTTSPIGAATDSQNPLEGWDPRACPPGTTATPAPANF